MAPTSKYLTTWDFLEGGGAEGTSPDEQLLKEGNTILTVTRPTMIMAVRRKNVLRPTKTCFYYRKVIFSTSSF